MTPKEKAKELVERFTFSCRECDYEENAIKCALIAVDLILDEVCDLYWHNVNDELNKLIMELNKL